MMKFLRKIKYWIYILLLSLNGNRFKKSNWKANNYCKRYRFFMLNWFDIWVNFGIENWMKKDLKSYKT